MSSQFIRVAQLATTPATPAKPASGTRKEREARPARVGRLPISPATLWRWTKEGKFPQPVRLGPQTTAWRTADVEAWERQQRAAM